MFAHSFPTTHLHSPNRHPYASVSVPPNKIINLVQHECAPKLLPITNLMTKQIDARRQSARAIVLVVVLAQSIRSPQPDTPNPPPRHARLRTN